MTRRRLSRSLRQRVIADFHNRCAYCHILTAITGAHLVIDHLVPEASGGQTVRENLCVACHSCNEFKGAQVEVLDPITGQQVRSGILPSLGVPRYRALGASFYRVIGPSISKA